MTGGYTMSHLGVGMMKEESAEDAGGIDYAYEKGDSDPHSVITGLCRLFYQRGWCTGTGGGISIRFGGRIYYAPSGVQKERITRSDIFVVAECTGEILETPNNDRLRMTACRPLFENSFKLRDAGACIHSHSMNAMLATLIFDSDEFCVSHLEMIKGVRGYNYNDRLVIPIIENTPHEEELEISMREAMSRYPKVPAVLVRRHGLYVWGADWVEAKRHAECIDYLCEAAVEMKRLGLDCTKGT